MMKDMVYETTFWVEDCDRQTAVLLVNHKVNGILPVCRARGIMIHPIESYVTESQAYQGGQFVTCRIPYDSQEDQSDVIGGLLLGGEQDA